MKSKIIKSPDCISKNKQHKVWELEGSLIIYECEYCFERFYLISETAAKAANLKLIPKE